MKKKILMKNNNIVNWITIQNMFKLFISFTIIFLLLGGNSILSFSAGSFIAVFYLVTKILLDN
jgi:hypothetical protein